MRRLLTLYFIAILYFQLCLISKTVATTEEAFLQFETEYKDTKSVGVGDDLAYKKNLDEIFDGNQQKSESPPKRDTASLSDVNNTLASYKGREILAISVFDDVLAVAFVESVILLNISAPKSANGFPQLASLQFPEPLKKNVFEFKLLNLTSVFICDNALCRLCTLLPFQKCYAYYLGENLRPRQQGQGLSVSAVLASDGDLVVRYIVSNETQGGFYAAIAKYDEASDDEGTVGQFDAATVYPMIDSCAGPVWALRRFIKPKQHTEDPSWYRKHFVAGGFNRGNFTYFVGSARRFEEAHVHNFETRKEKVFWSAAKITRICDTDRTEDLYSRIDLRLSCGNFTWGDEVYCEAATYNKMTDTLTIVMQPLDIDRSAVFCSFNMAKVAEEFDAVWKDCQQYSAMTRSDHTKFELCYRGSHPDNIPKSNECWVFMHKTFGQRIEPCSKYGDGPKKYENCKLDEYRRSTYLNAWLEKFYPFEGQVFGSIPATWSRTLWIQHFSDDSAMLMYTENGNVSRIYRNQHEYHWNENFGIKNALHIGLEAKTDQLVYVNGTNNVKSKEISCALLYKECESLERIKWSDPLKCRWCEKGGGLGVAISETQNCSGKIILKESCPPFLYGVYPKSSKGSSKISKYLVFDFFGGRFDRIKNATAAVCGKPCKVHKSRNGLICNMSDPLQVSTECIVALKGIMKSGSYFVTTFVLKATEPPEKPTPILKAGAKSKTKKVVATIACVIIFIALIFLIIWIFYRYNKKRRNKLWQGGTESNSQIPFGSINGRAFPHASVESNPYGVHKLNGYPLKKFNPYEKMYFEIDPKLQIRLEDLEIGEEIGKGNFGVVLKGIYHENANTNREVACKTIDWDSDGVVTGVSEFLREGLIMSNFDHPHVARLIGISLWVTGCPMIVTDFLANGDLHHYITNPKNRLTLGILLDFGIQIADGMEYLHEKKFIHRDLATRNCMLDADLVVKIADFGLSRDVSMCGMYEATNRDRGIPIRWMPIESLEVQNYTPKGDVWAYGVVLWELVTRGQVPYGSMDVQQIMRALKKGHRLSKPKTCPDILYYNVMILCWLEEPQRRPSFHELKEMMIDVVNQLKRGTSGTSLLNSHYERVCSRSAATTPLSYPKPFPAGPVVTDL